MRGGAGARDGSDAKKRLRGTPCCRNRRCGTSRYKNRRCGTSIRATAAFLATPRLKRSPLHPIRIHRHKVVIAGDAKLCELAERSLPIVRPAATAPLDAVDSIELPFEREPQRAMLLFPLCACSICAPTSIFGYRLHKVFHVGQIVVKIFIELVLNATVCQNLVGSALEGRRNLTRTSPQSK